MDTKLKNGVLESSREYIKVVSTIFFMCWRLLFGSSFCARKALKKNGIPAREEEAEEEVSPTKTRFAVLVELSSSWEEKPIHDEVFSEKYLDISGAVWTLRKMPSLEDRAEHQWGAERKREEWPHLDKSPPRNYLCLYCQSWPDISTADAVVEKKPSFTLHRVVVSKNDHHDNDIYPNIDFFLLHASLISAAP